MRERFVMLTAIFTVGIVTTFALWNQWKSPEIIEVRARVLPGGFTRPLVPPLICDLDEKGNQGLVVEVYTSSWLGRRKEQTFIVTMLNGRLLAFPIPISKIKPPPKGRRLIGMTKAGELAIAE